MRVFIKLHLKVYYPDSLRLFNRVTGKYMAVMTFLLPLNRENVWLSW